MKKIIGLLLFCINITASNTDNSLQKILLKSPTEQAIEKLAKFHKLLDKIHSEKSVINFNAGDYTNIEKKIYTDVKTALGSRGSLLVDLNKEEHASCCYNCKRSSIELYMNLLSSGYKGSTQEKHAAYIRCKNTLQSAFEVLRVHDVQQLQTQSSVMKRD